MNFSFCFLLKWLSGKVRVSRLITPTNFNQIGAEVSLMDIKAIAFGASSQFGKAAEVPVAGTLSATAVATGVIVSVAAASVAT